MNKAAAIVVSVFFVGFLVCLVVTIPLLFWALRLEDEENGIAQGERKNIRDIGAVIIVAIVLSLVWVLMFPLYVLMLAEKIAGRGEDS